MEPVGAEERGVSDEGAAGISGFSPLRQAPTDRYYLLARNEGVDLLLFVFRRLLFVVGKCCWFFLVF